jgi:hypothetical protein
MATLLEMRTDVRERIGEDQADFFTNAEVDRAINLAQTTFTAEELWPWLFTEWVSTVAAGQDTLELPDNVSIHRTFNLSLLGDPGGSNLQRSKMLERVTPEEGFRIRHSYEALTQAPTYYYLTSATVENGETIYVIKLTPVPDLDYDLEALYLRVPLDLSADGDTPDLPQEFHPALPAWAAGHLYLKEMDISQKANEQFQLYYGVLAQAKKLLEVQVDENVAWSRELPTRKRSLSVYDRIPLTLGP